MCVCIYIYVGVFACEHRCPQKPEKDVGSSGAAVTGDCKVLNMSVGKQSQVQHKNSTT